MSAPPSFSGVVPSLAQVADFGPPRSEIGIGCLMPWNGCLYVLNYSSHRRTTGTGTGLRIISPDFRMQKHPAAIDGTYANRFVHHPSNQLVIGPHVVTADHEVRTVEALADVRLCGTATHLTEPERLVYMLGMEGELYELDVFSLETRLIFDLQRELKTPGEGSCHFKDCYTGCGRLVVANNDYSEPDFLGVTREGTLAEYDGTGWRILENTPYVGLAGMGFFGDTIFASGWDKASAVLSVFTKADALWRKYRLPKASHCFDHKWQTEWPRIRAVEHERFLMDHHGMFYELSPWAYNNRIWGVRPVSTHLWVHGDFCSWRGMLVMGADNASVEAGYNGLCAEPQSGIWMGRTDDLWKLGKPSGWGGPWWDTTLEAGAVSEPYLMTGFDKKCLHVSHNATTQVRFVIEIDFRGDGHYHACHSMDVPANGYAQHCFPDGLSAHWVRLRCEGPCTATAQFHYT
jgi:hypothetical protein